MTPPLIRVHLHISYYYMKGVGGVTPYFEKNCRFLDFFSALLVLTLTSGFQNAREVKASLGHSSTLNRPALTL